MTAKDSFCPLRITLKPDTPLSAFNRLCNYLEDKKCFIQSGGEKGGYWIIVDNNIYQTLN